MRSTGLHIGLSTAATKALQNNVFRLHPDVFYLGKNQEDPELENATIAIKRYTNSNQLPPNWVQTIRDRIQKSQDQNLIPLYSDEELSTYRYINPRQYIQRWYAIIPDAKILFIIQNPAQWLISLFFFRLLQGKNDVLLGFEKWTDKFTYPKRLNSPISEVFYTDIYHLYSHLFPEHNILVLPIELIKENPGLMCDRIEDHWGLPSNSLHDLLISSPILQESQVNGHTASFLYSVFTHFENGETHKALEMIDEINREKKKSIEGLIHN